MDTHTTLIFVLLGVIITIAINPLLNQIVSAQLSHDYCFTYRQPGSSGITCSESKNECEEERDRVENEGISSVGDSCFAFTPSDGNNQGNYCFDLAANDPAKCFDSEPECQSNREAMLGGNTAFRVASECYMNID
jgi:hypothetical protein